MKKAVVLGVLGAAIAGIYFLGNSGGAGGGITERLIPGGILGSPAGGGGAAGVSGAGKQAVAPSFEFTGFPSLPAFQGFGDGGAQEFFDEGKPYSTQAKKSYSPTDPGKKGGYITPGGGGYVQGPTLGEKGHQGFIGGGGSSYTNPSSIGSSKKSSGANGSKSAKSSTPATAAQQQAAMSFSMSMATGGIV